MHGNFCYALYNAIKTRPEDLLEEQANAVHTIHISQDKDGMRKSIRKNEAFGLPTDQERELSDQDGMRSDDNQANPNPD